MEKKKITFESDDPAFQGRNSLWEVGNYPDLKCGHCQVWLLCNWNRPKESRKQAYLQLEDDRHAQKVARGGGIMPWGVCISVSKLYVPGRVLSPGVSHTGLQASPDPHSSWALASTSCCLFFTVLNFAPLDSSFSRSTERDCWRPGQDDTEWSRNRNLWGSFCGARDLAALDLRSSSESLWKIKGFLMDRINV